MMDPSRPEGDHPWADRRTARRYRAVAGRGWLGWKEWRGFRRVGAWVLDVSQGGALLAVDELPPVGLPAWIRLESPGVLDWAEVRVVSTRANGPGPHACRVLFPGSCPYELFKRLAWGPGTLADGRA